MKRKNKTEVFLVTLKIYFPAMTLRPFHELCSSMEGTFFRKQLVIDFQKDT